MMASKGLKAAELSRRSGVDKAYISMLLSGKRQNPSEDVILKIASGLRVTVNQLLTGNDDGEPVNLREIERKETVKLTESATPYGIPNLTDSAERGIFGYTLEELLERIETLANQSLQGDKTAAEFILFMIPILKARIALIRNPPEP